MSQSGLETKRPALPATFFPDQGPLAPQYVDELDDHQSIISFFVARKRGKDADDGCVLLVGYDDQGNKLYVKAFVNEVPTSGGPASRALQRLRNRVTALEAKRAPAS